MKIARFIIFFVATLFLIACGEKMHHQFSESAPAEGWTRAWKPSFTFEVKDTLAVYNTYIDLRHTGEYPYSNLYLFMKLANEDGIIAVDTVECPLAAPDGKWYGKGLGFIHEDRFDAHVLYKYQNRFPQSGKYTLTLEQAMRRPVLEGVLDAGISMQIVDP